MTQLTETRTDLARHDADSLAELLRRCHREELLPLARRLGVNPHGLGLDHLATNIGRTLRRKGSSGFANLFRGGQGPTYEAVLERLVRKAGMVPGADAERMERALMEWVLRKSWEAMEDEERQVVWADLELVGPVPDDGTEALETARQSLGGRFAWNLARLTGFGAASVAGFALPLLMPIAGCATLFYLSRPNDAEVLPAVLEVGRLRQQLRHRVTVGVVGSPSSGKDAAIGAIFGLDTGNVNPVAGSTKEVAILRLPEATSLWVVNTPGMGDIIESVTEEARQVLAFIDVFVYVVNAQGGVQAREQADYAMCQRSGRPVLAVVNKIDTLREDQRDSYLADARTKLDAPEEDFLAAAFDPLPQLSETPIGVDEVRAWLTTHLDELGKDTRELPW
ncbi:MAG: hypothetical protein EP330_11685 [Deltaproteobacteria bacterium]|nr:MAG: hypothetical protein EP330_11685 [Deltaproteobacteria bacterium]